MRRPALLAHLLLLAVVMVWGCTFVLVKQALADCSPLLFNLLRMALAALVLLVLNRQHLRNLTIPALISNLMVGLFLAAGYQFQTLGLALTTPAKSAFLTGLVVVFVPLLSAVPALRPTGSRAPGHSALAGALLAFLGLLLLTTPPGTPASQLFSKISRGDGLTLLCALAFAGHLLALAHASRTVPTRQLATLQISFATLFTALTLPFGGPPVFHATPRLAVALAITSVVATAFAFTAQSWAQQHLSPTHTALLLSLEPVFAALTSYVLFHESLGRRGLTGAAFILAGILVAELLIPSASTSPPQPPPPPQPTLLHPPRV